MGRSFGSFNRRCYINSLIDCRFHLPGCSNNIRRFPLRLGWSVRLDSPVFLLPPAFGPLFKSLFDKCPPLFYSRAGYISWAFHVSVNMGPYALYHAFKQFGTWLFQSSVGMLVGHIGGRDSMLTR